MEKKLIQNGSFCCCSLFSHFNHFLIQFFVINAMCSERKEPFFKISLLSLYYLCFHSHSVKKRFETFSSKTKLKPNHTLGTKKKTPFSRKTQKYNNFFSSKTHSLFIFLLFIRKKKKKSNISIKLEKACAFSGCSFFSCFLLLFQSDFNESD